MTAARVRSLAAIAAAAGLFVAGPCLSQQSLPNPFVAAYGADLDVAEIDLHINDGLLPGHQDRAAWTYLQRTMPPEQKALFEARTARLVEAQAAERLAEFLAVANLQGRLAERPAAGRQVRLVVRVDEARAESMLRMLAVPSLTSKFPRLAMEIAVQDIASGRALVTGRIERVESSAADNIEARDRLGLTYSWLGTDTHLQILAGMSNALAASLETLLRARAAPGGSAVVAVAPVAPGINVPIRINRAVYVLEVSPPPAELEAD